MNTNLNTKSQNDSKLISISIQQNWENTFKNF